MIAFSSTDAATKMPIDLYHIPGSPPCHTVRLVASALGVELNLKFVDLLENEHNKPEFLKVISLFLYSEFKYSNYQFC